jgi:NTE family protein
LADSLQIVQRTFPNPLPVKPKNIVALKIEGLSNADERIVANAVNVNYTGEKVPADYLETLNNLYGTDDFEKVAYHIEYDSTRFGYVFTANMKAKKNPASLNASINYNTDFGVQLLLNYTHRNLFFPGYRLLSDIVVSESPAVRFTYSSSFGPKLLPSGGVSFFSYRQPLYVEGKVFSRYVFQNLIAKVGMQSNINVNSVLGFDLAYNFARFSGDAFEFAGTEAVTFDYLNLQFHYQTSTLRDAYFPTKGKEFNFKTSLASKLSGNQFTNPYLFYTLSFKQAFPLGNRATMQYSITSGSSLNRKLEGPNTYYIGGYGNTYPINMLSFFGYERMELFNDGLNALGTEIHYNFYGKHYFKAIANAGYAMDLTSSDPLKFNSTFIAGYGGGYAYNSPVGPMQIFVARNAAQPTWKLYLYLGFWF